MKRPLLLLPALVCASTFAQTPAAPKQIPVEAFTRFDEFTGMKISPDGRTIALLGGEQGRSQLAFIDLVDKKAVGGLRTRDYTRISTYHWVSPSRLIYTVEGGGPSRSEPLVNDTIYGVDRDGSSHTRVFSGGRAELLRTFGKNPDRLLVAEYPLRQVGFYYYYNPEGRVRVRSIDIHSYWSIAPGSVDTSPLKGGRLVLDGSDRVRFTVGTNEQSLAAASWKPDPDGAWQTFDLDGFRREGATAVGFGADDRSALLTGVRLDEEFAALYRLDLPARQASKVFGFGDADVDDVIRDFADREIVGVRGHRERPSEHWIVPEHPVAKAYVALQRAFPGQRVRITSASVDGQRAVVFVDSDISPGDYYLFDTTQQRAEFLRAARAWIDPRSMRPKQPITLAARDGLQLHGYVTRPATDSPAPLVVLPHDGPWGERDTWEFESEVQLLANRGYAVLQVNYRGSTGYGVTFERAGDGEWGGKIQNDLTDATRWAIEQGIARADRICIYGKGYGGYAALMSVVRERGLFRCAIGYGVVYDLTTEARRPSRTRTEITRIERVFGTDVDKLRSLSPEQDIRSINAPVLLIHGKHDANVEYEQFRQMRHALRRQRKDKVEFMTLPREGSAVYDEETRREVYERILQFLAANLSASPGTP